MHCSQLHSMFPTPLYEWQLLQVFYFGLVLLVCSLSIVDYFSCLNSDNSSLISCLVSSLNGVKSALNNVFKSLICVAYFAFQSHIKGLCCLDSAIFFFVFVRDALSKFFLFSLFLHASVLWFGSPTHALVSLNFNTLLILIYEGVYLSNCRELGSYVAWLPAGRRPFVSFHYSNQLTDKNLYREHEHGMFLNY